jgi:hypothetical protein
MNITTSQFWPNPSAQASKPRMSTEHDSGAFQRTLRSMENDMWAGAESEIPNGSRPSVEQSRRSPVQTHARVILQGAPDALMTASSTSSEFVGTTADRTYIFTANGYSLRPATSLSARKSLTQASERNWPDVQAGFPEVVREPILDPRVAPEPAAPTRGTQRIVARALAYTPAAAPASSNADGATPYQLSVSVEGSGVSIALRLSRATSDDLAQLKQKALAEARRHGGRNVRLVVNGIDQITTSLRGASNGY